MVRKTQFSVTLVVAALVWSGLIFGGLLGENSALNTIVKALPGYLLMVFGCFSLYSIGTDLWVLKEFPEDYQTLLKEIEASKSFYKTKGVKLN